jgi:hypothetical protein
MCLRTCPVALSCEHGTEMGFHKKRKFLEKLSSFQSCNMDFVAYFSFETEDFRERDYKLTGSKYFSTIINFGVSIRFSS